MDVDSADDMDYLPSSGETADSVDTVDHNDEPQQCVSVGEGEVNRDCTRTISGPVPARNNVGSVTSVRLWRVWSSVTLMSLHTAYYFLTKSISAI